MVRIKRLSRSTSEQLCALSRSSTPLSNKLLLRIKFPEELLDYLKMVIGKSITVFKGMFTKTLLTMFSRSQSWSVTYRSSV